MQLNSWTDVFPDVTAKNAQLCEQLGLRQENILLSMLMFWDVGRE